MVITKDDNTNKIIFTYNDPLGRSLNDRPDLVALITDVCSDAEIIDLKTPQQAEGNTSDYGVFVCDNLIRQSQDLEILSMEQCREQGLNLRKPQAETLKQSLIAQQAQHYHIDLGVGDSSSDEEDDDKKGNNSNNNEEIAYSPYGDNVEVDGLGIASQHNE
ncbi:ubiquitin family protein [Rickettsia australis]|uniref:RickCE-like catalytic domain-containing protein n=1 Tax=Rickettsia australis (strain Cutlack) TaxID=1105110 RepID=H8K937_RICAC|nr:hypothetical protein [Rickettsia australis]AFC70557.1 hypothetical protein MC5_00700 [Rickettsia australis str. Cutlack]